VGRQVFSTALAKFTENGFEYIIAGQMISNTSMNYKSQVVHSLTTKPTISFAMIGRFLAKDNAVPLK